MDFDIAQDFLMDEDVKTADCEGDLESVKFWVALIIGSWYLVGFSRGLRWSVVNQTTWKTSCVKSGELVSLFTGKFPEFMAGASIYKHTRTNQLCDSNITTWNI